MSQTGRNNKKYSAEFKIGVIMAMREHHLGYRETVRKNWGVPPRARPQLHQFSKTVGTHILRRRSHRSDERTQRQSN
jgi:hypothetical protein